MDGGIFLFEVSVADLSEVTSNNAGHGANGQFIRRLITVHFVRDELVEQRLGVTG